MWSIFTSCLLISCAKLFTPRQREGWSQKLVNPRNFRMVARPPTPRSPVCATLKDRVRLCTVMTWNMFVLRYTNTPFHYTTVWTSIVFSIKQLDHDISECCPAHILRQQCVSKHHRVEKLEITWQQMVADGVSHIASKHGGSIELSWSESSK